MSNVKIKANASGTADFTIEAPATDSALTLTLPSVAGELLTTTGDGSGLTGISSYADSDALDLFNATGSAPVYACRAWVNFNGTGTVAIRASGNVSSITDHANGQYTVNFATAMPDTDYATSISVGFSSSSGDDWVFMHERMDFKATSSTRLHIAESTVSTNEDMFGVFVAIFR
jgi:hypothetical protein